MAIIEMKKVSFRYSKHGTYVLKDLTYSFEKGKITSIAGASGSGKSTILMLLSALDNKYDGEIIFDGNELKRFNQNNYRAKNIGVIFQNYNLLFHASTIDNVKMGLYLSGEKRNSSMNESAVKLLMKVGITADKYRRKCLHLSGGEQQRVAIARALAGSPDIIIADEPTGNLDEVNQNSVLEIFSEIAKKDNKCVIIATHSKAVTEFSDFVINL